MSYAYYVDENGKVTKNNKKKKQTEQFHYTVDENGKVTKNNIEDIAPVKKTTTSKSNSKKKNKWYEGYLQLGDALSDGYDFGDITKTYVATHSDIVENLTAGVIGMGEKIVDAGAYVAGGVGGLFGADDFKKKTEKFIEKDLYDEKKVAEKLVSVGVSPLNVTQPLIWADRLLNGGKEDNSIYGDKADSLIQSGGQLLATAGLQYLGVPWYLTTGTTSFGGQAETALNEGATYEQAGGSALISAGAEILFEKLGGGIKFGGGKATSVLQKLAEKGKLGGKTLQLMQKLDGNTTDDLLLRPLTEKISNKLLKKAVNLGLDAGGEGIEELLTSMASRAGTGLYKEESLEELLWSEEAVDEYIDSLFGGFLMGGSSGVVKSFTKSNLTENEQKVVDKEVENRISEAEKKGKTIWAKDREEIYNKVLNDLSKGGISTDTIESVLGDKTYETYKTMEEQENALKEEIESLENTPKEQFTVKQDERLKELREELAKIDKTQIKEQLSNEVSELVKDSRLVESYNEKARRSQAFTADLTKYDVKQQETVKRAIDSGVLNNTNRTHEYVDLVAKVSADKGVLFDFTNNEKIKELGLAVEGKTVNGYVTKDGVIGVNVESGKSLNRIVGHEITHVFESDEILHNDLKKVAKAFATTKGEYDTRIQEMTKLYTDKDGKLMEGVNIENEVTADLIGDYLFSDDDFINKLSTEQPNIFKKIFDEIKYLCKVATAGSKEARQLEKLKRTFVKAYQQTTSINNTDTKYSFSGTRAKTADSSLFLKADRMLDKGFDSETVRQETGWFKGYDGKMRFEIDDSQMKVYPNGDLKYRKAHPEYVELEELKKKQAKSELTEEELARLNKLDNIWGNEANRWNELLRSGNLQLENILEHDKLYASYPELKDIDIKIASSESGYLGEYNASKNSITINEKLLEGDTTEVKKTLIHEIQHAIQHIEGFTTGSSREYWQDKIDDGYLIKTNEQNTELQKLKKEYEDISKAEPELVREINELEESTPTVSRGAFDFETFEQIEDDPIEWQIFDKKRELLEQKYGDEKVSKLMYLNYKIENLETKGMTASDAYYKTAGEIEARDTASRLSLNEEQRKATRPSIDREDVVFSDNTNPTSNDDVRFSLSEPVEQAKDLVAIHNLQASELAKTLELGGLPMPSVAIIKAKQNFDKYGDVSLILNKDAIDPKASKDNKVYGGDAWTPVYPKIEYKPNDKVAKQIKDKYYELSDKIGYDDARPMYNYVYELEDVLNRNGGEAGMLQKLYDDTGMMQVFLEDSGKGKVENIIKETRTEATEAEKEQNQWFIDKLGEDVIRAVKIPKGQKPIEYRTEYMSKYGEQIKSAYESLLRDKYGLEEDRVKNIIDKTKAFGLLKYARNAELYLNNGGVTVKTETDYEATREAIKEKASDGYKEWIDSLFKGVEEKSGIRNNEEYFTRSGNRRSWDVLHWENTLENVVKAMKSQDQTGADAKSPSSAIFAVSQKKYGSIDDIKADSNRLEEISEEDYKALEESYANRLVQIANSITDENAENPFIAMDESAELIVDAVRTKKTKASMLSYMQKWNKKVTSKTVDDIISLVSDIANMPTGYFEAKPQRAVGLDEVGVFVLPYNADAKLKQQLLNKGYSIAEYNPDVEGDRQRVVNQFEDYKFSLSNREQITAPYGKYDIYGKDVALETPVQKPVQEVAPVQETVPVQQNNQAIDYAPLPEEQSNESDVEQSVTSMSPEEFEKVVQSYMDDAPPFLFDDDEIRAWAEEEARKNPQGATPKENTVIPESPLAERDIYTIGKERKTNAYMYENPEVKPYFQEEAQVMLWELQNSTKGERLRQGSRYGIDDYGIASDEGWYGTKRQTSEALAYLRDNFKYDTDELTKGLKAIIEDHGAENNAISKRIEFMLDERLREGYKDFMSNERKAPNQDYINLLNEKQITEYNDEAFNNWVQTLKDEDISPMQEDIAPVQESVEQILYSLEETKNKELSDIDTKVEEAENAEEPELTVNESYNARLENYNNAIEGYKTARTEIETTFDDAIEKKSKEYEALKRKDTKKASDILMQIENLKLRKANNLSNIDSRIDKTQTRVDNMIANADSIKQGMYGRRRKALHTNIMSRVKEAFATKGFDFDKVLKNAKNKSTIASNDNTPQRFMEKTLGDEEGKILADMTVNQVAQNESAGIKWVNENVSLLKQISKEYGIKPRSKESASAQMYAEGFYADENGDLVAYGDKELEADFKDAKVRENIKKLAKDARIRSIYDETLDQINKSRTRNAYPEIPKRDNYFLHFIEMDDAFSRLGIPFNPNEIKSKDLPTDLNGMTVDLKPGQPYFASAMQRTGYKTTYDLLGGVERYLNSAKNQIYHIDDIQTLRATRNYIADMYGQAHGFENLDNMTEEEISDKIEKIKGSHLSVFARFLNEEANVIAGKTSLIDRAFEGAFGRRSLTFVDTVNRQVGSNAIGGNVSSSLTNFISVVQSMAKSNLFDSFKAFTQTVSNKIGSIYGRTDGFADVNPGIIRRKGIDKFAKKPFEKITEPAYFLMTATDDISTEIIVRTKFNELTRKGMSEEQAHIESDKWAHRILGDRSLGQQPLYYNSKALGLITKFQLEVRNNLDSTFYDTIQEAKLSTKEIDNALARNAVKSAKITATLVQLAVLQHVFGKAFESVAGYNPAFDMIEILMQTFGFDDEEDSEDTPLDNIEQGFLSLLEDMPYASVLTGGGRIPISSALPVKEFVYGVDSYGRDKNRGEILKEALPYYLFPTGYGQIKKTKKGLEMFSDEHPVSGSYTDSGNLRFPVEDTTKNRIQAGLFGQYANENARYYFDNDIAPLKEKQIQEYIDVDMPIKDYWKYREGLKGLKNLNEKGDYIGGLDLPIGKKNILINNVANRKDPIAFTGYEDYSNFQEFDFANRYPEKYQVLQEQGISVKDYKENHEKTAFIYTDAYSWASNNNEKYLVSKAVTDDVSKYKQYTSDISKIKSDKDSNGKTISGSRKEKVIDYINNLDADYGQRIILFKSIYDKDDTYNYDIVDYLNSRDDITFDEMNTILEELGFTVTADGTIYWD